MRRDMAKLLCERPRIGGKYAKPRRDRQTNPGEDSPNREPIGRKWHGQPKQLNENLSPLYRFLRSRVGHPWDEVYSELREHVRVDSAIQLHILQHLWQFVVRDVVLNDGVPCYGSNEPWGSRLGRPLTEFRYFRGVMYVHPVSGLLLATTLKTRKKRGKPQPRHRPAAVVPRTLTDGRQLHKIGDAWYAVELAAIPPGAPPERDVILGPGPRLLWQHWEALPRTYGKPGVYGIRAERLTPRLVRKLGLE